MTVSRFAEWFCWKPPISKSRFVTYDEQDREWMFPLGIKGPQPTFILGPKYLVTHEMLFGNIGR